MASQRAGSKDIVESATGDVVERVSMSLPIYEDIMLLIDKDIKMKWQQHHKQQHNQQQHRVAHLSMTKVGGRLLTAQRQSKAASSKQFHL